ncbi:MAG: alanine--tRNA ligase [Acidimicrobiales bacterium]|tara:strand:- start:8379 stop:10958 length:2580 start_codon:yes stop_codon:yes gene_type:complete
MRKKALTAKSIRREFIDFYVARDHFHESSDSLIPDDSTLLFTNSGMVQFKSYLTGEQPAPWPRAVTVQKCARAGGKHNDLEEVGRTSRHLTFFEMMGNFSFGDYFKSEACAFAWEFVTKNLGLDPERLWITVHETDDEAATIWEEEVGVSADRIQRLDEDNYWRMADTGPCGPCSEIFWDKGPEHGEEGGPAHGGEERFVEIWNLVFMQFEQHADGSQTPLPAPSIDTGLGLERVLSVLQGVDSVWETDEFSTLLKSISELTQVAQKESESFDVSMRILADHARSSTFLINDGVFPSNEDRGYVLRRIIRRAVRHAWLLGVEDQIMASLVDVVVEMMGSDYPELAQNHDYIRGVIDREEEGFRETLRSGLTILDTAIDGLKTGEFLDGQVIFKLHDTYGFPLELTEEITRERGISIDSQGFSEAMNEQKERAKAARKENGTADISGDLRPLLEEHGLTSFIGREENKTEAEVLYIENNYVVLDRTPFYAESGGQIGDTGTLTNTRGAVRVIDTKLALDGLHVHETEDNELEIAVGDKLVVEIDVARRMDIRRNHTATHLLHSALRRVLGEHVKQQGSWVGPDRLRFDFSHYAAVQPEEIREIEDMVNMEVLNNLPCNHYETSKEKAEAAGAIAFFGDKYGDSVRVLEAGPSSIELCGGTHVNALGDIGAFKIITEGSVGANIRRIEAITGPAPINRLRDLESTLASASEKLGVPIDDVLEGIDKRIAENKEIKNELNEVRRALALNQVDALVETAENGLVIAQVTGVDQDGLRELATAISSRGGIRAVVLGLAPEGGGAALVSIVTSDSGLDAGALVSESAKTIGGGGRLNSEMTVIGGRQPENLQEALDQARHAAETI